MRNDKDLFEYDSRLDNQMPFDYNATPSNIPPPNEPSSNGGCFLLIICFIIGIGFGGWMLNEIGMGAMAFPIGGLIGFYLFKALTK